MGKTGEIAGGGAEEVVAIGMKDHVWGETKRFLIELGLSNPSDADIMKYAKIVAEESGVAVREWGLSGKILDTEMPAGFLLKFGRVATELSKLSL